MTAAAYEFGPRLAALDRACRMAERKHGMVSPEALAASAAWCKEWHRVIALRSRLRADGPPPTGEEVTP